MNKKTINGMHKNDLLALIKDSIVKINKIDGALEKTDSINALHEQIKKKNKEIDVLYRLIFNEDGQKNKINSFLGSAEAVNSDIEAASNKILNEDDGFLIEIERAYNQSFKKLKSIKDFYKNIYGNEDNTGIEIELTNLVNGFNEKDKEINQAHNKIFNTEEENEESGLLESIQNSQQEAEKKLDDIRDFYKETFKDTDSTKSIQNKLNEFVNEFQEHNDNFKKLHNDIFGYTENNDDDEEITHSGELNQTRKIFKKYQKKYNFLFEQIEGLLSGATTTSLSKNFDDKVKEYSEERKKWETRIFVFLIILFIISTIFALIVVFKENINQNIIYTIGMPIYTFSIWLMIFMGNRRAESRKLEESFKHKFVMAKSFVGYKKSILDMEDIDEELMKIHMNNLLNAISKDSSKFFETKGESHPILDYFKKAKSSDNNSINGVTP
jgi:hypothetical protein